MVAPGFINAVLSTTKWRFYTFVMNVITKSCRGGNIFTTEKSRIILALCLGWLLAEVKNDFWPLFESWGTAALDYLDEEFDITRNDLLILFISASHFIVVNIYMCAILALIYVVVTMLPSIFRKNTTLYTKLLLLLMFPMCAWGIGQIITLLYMSCLDIPVNNIKLIKPQRDQVDNPYFTQYWTLYTRM